MRGCKSVTNRKEYFHQYYEEHKDKIKKNYNAQTQYLKWVDIKKTLFRLKRRIGADAYDLIMDEIEKLERVKH